MQQILLIVQVLVAFGLIALILLQQGKGADAGAAFGGGSSGSLFGSRGATSFLAKSTAVLAAVFFVNSIALGYLAGQSVERRSVVEQFQSAPADEGGVQDVPTSSGFGGVQTTSDVPVAPATTDTSQ